MTCCFDGSAEEAWARRAKWSVTDVLIEESHFGVTLLRCDGCGRRLAKVFCERIDWQGGNDPQAWKILPVSEGEADELRRLGEGAHEGALGRLSPRRCLEAYFPSDGAMQIDWVEGPGVFMPHD